MTQGGSAEGRRPWPRAPISLQLVVLLIASLLVAQAISFGVILLIPPPRPPVSRVSDVAAAIRRVGSNGRRNQWVVSASGTG